MGTRDAEPSEGLVRSQPRARTVVGAPCELRTQAQIAREVRSAKKLVSLGAQTSSTEKIAAPRLRPSQTCMCVLAVLP
jgi:hypothetical protein